ncbi:hypothetical protein SADO_08077 [Salinisphaera dokdonensis CL-ES53]|uniref:T6SS Phospholipase effector Tle1-like catalytic domain-containing protein n=1 Tax=Salinisphaera dokdonensis CL-ES53 TaxID=1304272 RepID=A0ABV2B1C3_9GAMM
MSKDIVVCCDGTNSQFGGLNTNVVHLYEALASDRTDQVSFYEPGVGTFGADFFGVNVGETMGKLLGAGFGYGIQQNLVRAYRFLIDTYVAGDRLFIFGFSRGAFTARTLAALVDTVGVLETDARDRAKAAVKAYLDDGEAEARDAAPTARACAPYFVGVWETVGALGLLMRLRRFHDNRLSPGVTHAVQALAIDERRGPFKPTLWDEQSLEPGQHVRQVWFAGVHSDVGGGYAERGLADLSLRWMLERAQAAGLALKLDAREHIDGDPAGRLHESYRGAWRTLGKHVRQPGADASFHASVAERLAQVPAYDPDNLPAAVREASSGPR